MYIYIYESDCEKIFKQLFNMGFATVYFKCKVNPIQIASSVTVE